MIIEKSYIKYYINQFNTPTNVLVFNIEYSVINTGLTYNFNNDYINSLTFDKSSNQMDTNKSISFPINQSECFLQGPLISFELQNRPDSSKFEINNIFQTNELQTFNLNSSANIIGSYISNMTIFILNRNGLLIS